MFVCRAAHARAFGPAPPGHAPTNPTKTTHLFHSSAVWLSLDIFAFAHHPPLTRHPPLPPSPNPTHKHTTTKDKKRRAGGGRQPVPPPPRGANLPIAPLPWVTPPLSHCADAAWRGCQTRHPKTVLLLLRDRERVVCGGTGACVHACAGCSVFCLFLGCKVNDTSENTSRADYEGGERRPDRLLDGVDGRRPAANAELGTSARWPTPSRRPNHHQRQTPRSRSKPRTKHM